MDGQLIRSAALSGDPLPLSDDYAPGDHVSGDRAATPVKDWIFSMLPPATVVAILAFWAFVPKSLAENMWTPVVVGVVTTFFVLGLEKVHERHAGWRINKREFFTDLFYFVLNLSVISWAVTTLSEDPMKAAKHSLGLSTPWSMQLPFLAQVALVIVIHEFGQYWMHRLMHNNAFFWSTHAPHHHITQLNAMKGAVGNPIELFLIGLSAVALLDLTPVAVFAAFNALGAISTFNHANVRADPPRWYSFFFTTIRHHSLHHTALSYEDTRCNYGNSLILLDRIFGTYREGESSVVGQDERKRLSIMEQFLFPFRPLIEKYNSRQVKRASATSGTLN